MNSDSIENIGIGRRENLGHRAARRQACGENPFLLTPNSSPGFAPGPRAWPALPILGSDGAVKPIPATGRIRTPRLVWIGDDETEFIGQIVHLRSQRKIVRILRTSMQHEQQSEVPLIVIGRDVKPVIERAGRAPISARGKFSPKSCARASGAGAWAASGGMGGGRAIRAKLRPMDAGRGRRAEPGGSCGEVSGLLRAPPLLTGQRLAQKSGRLGKVRVSHKVQGLAHGVKKARFHHRSQSLIH